MTSLPALTRPAHAREQAGAPSRRRHAGEPPPSSNSTTVGNVQVRIRVALPRDGTSALLEVSLPRREHSEQHLRTALAALPARATSAFVVHTDHRVVAHATLAALDGSKLSQKSAMAVLSTLRERLIQEASQDDSGRDL